MIYEVRNMTLESKGIDRSRFVYLISRKRFLTSLTPDVSIMYLKSESV